MKLKIRELLKVWNAYDFLQFPRMNGDPIQTPIYNEKDFVNWFKANTGRAICFTSHNSYPTLDKTFHPPAVMEVRVSNLFTDFDDKDKPENAQLDTIKLIKFCEDNKLPFINSFSGSKGFHHFIRLKPSLHAYNEELKLMTRAVHNWLKDRLEFRTMDGMCKEPRRLCRIPYSKHVREGKERGSYIISDTYCHTISPDDITTKDIYEIIENARAPTLYIPDLTKPKLDLQGFIEHFEIDLREYAADKEVVNGERVVTHREYEEVQTDDLHELVKALVPRMCVHNDLFSRNPTHPARRMTVIQLKEIGYSFSQVVALFEEMSSKFNWVDRMFRGRRIYQIKHIYFHWPVYKHDTCGKIKNEHGLCVGEACPKFRGW